MDFYEEEANDAVRFSWNKFVSTKQMLTRAVVPMGCLYTPKKDLENIAYVEYDPLKCSCEAIINPFCNIDYQNKYWLCPFCNKRNKFP